MKRRLLKRTKRNERKKSVRVKKKSKGNRKSIGSKNRLKDAVEANRQKVEAEVEVDVRTRENVTSRTREIKKIDIYLEKAIRDPDESEKEVGAEVKATHITARAAREGSAPRSVLVVTALQIRT
jgi:hypothetical protein